MLKINVDMETAFHCKVQTNLRLPFHMNAHLKNIFEVYSSIMLLVHFEEHGPIIFRTIMEPM